MTVLNNKQDEAIGVVIDDEEAIEFIDDSFLKRKRKNKKGEEINNG